MYNSNNATLNIPSSMINACKDEILDSRILFTPKVIFEIITTLKHARTFITTKQRMHSTGIELYDELIVFLEEKCKEEECK